MSSLNSLWLAQARRIGCQTHALQEEKKTAIENEDCFNSVTDEFALLCVCRVLLRFVFLDLYYL